MAKKKHYQPSLLDTFKTNVSTVTELRVGIFAPITQITAASQTYKNFVANSRERRLQTPWGSVIVRGNILTQVHRDIIDAIFSTATNVETTQNGNIALFFSGYEVQKFLGKKSSTNNNWLKKKLNEIKTTNVEFRDAEGNEYDFNITDSGGYSVKRDSFVIVFTESYMKFFQNQVTVDYRKELRKVLELEEPLIKAIIRFFFTHANNMTIELTKLLNILGYSEGERALKEARKKIRSNLEKLSEFGITVDTKKYILSYKKLQSVTHTIPEKENSTLLH